MTDATTFRRQKAIDDLLRFMGCTDAKASNCDHVGAIAELVDASYQTLFEEWDRITDGAMSEFGLRPRTELYLRDDDPTGHREGRLR